MEKVWTNKEIELFFELLRVGLWEDAKDESAGGQMSDIQVDNFKNLPEGTWTAIHDAARAQTVTGLVFRAVGFLPEDCLPPESLLARWAAEVEAIERMNEKMAAAQAGLLEYFGSFGLKPVVMKGLSVAKYYAAPELRECGDIDLYFPFQETEGDTFKAALEAWEHERSVMPQKKSDGSWLYSWEGIPVEQHPRLLDISNPFKAKKLKELEALYGADSPMMTMLLLNAHILKHAMGRGVGLRQVCDYARAWSSLEPQIVEQEYADACRELGISRWTEILNSFVVNWLKMNVKGDRKSGKLLDIILKSGNFGRLKKDSVTASAFLRNFGFGVSVAPVEYFSLICELAVGRLRG